MSRKIRTLIGFALFTLALVASAACTAITDTSSEPTEVGATATAMLSGPNGVAMGIVSFTQTPHGVLVSADVSGLEPGGHGFHIHEFGDCTPDFSAAGDHFNPGDRTHGYYPESGYHAGDMPNIYAHADGTARADHLVPAISLGSGDKSVFDADGSAIIVHEKPDTYGIDAGAGGRVACGVIQR